VENFVGVESGRRERVVCGVERGGKIREKDER